MSIFFLTLDAINLFGSDLCNAMSDSENEMEKRKSAYVAPKDQKKSGEVEAIKENDILSQVSVYHDNSSFGILPDEILAYISSFLRIDDLGRVALISRRWNRTCNDPQLWRKVGLKNYENYLTRTDLEEEPKEKVIHRHLSGKLSILDAKGEEALNKKFKGEYDMSIFTTYFKLYLPLVVKNGHESLEAITYWPFPFLGFPPENRIR